MAKFNVYNNIACAANETTAKYIIAAVRSAHIKFYKRLFFSPISEEKSYPHLKFKTILLVCDNVKGFADFIQWKSSSVH